VQFLFENFNYGEITVSVRSNACHTELDCRHLAYKYPYCNFLGCLHRSILQVDTNVIKEQAATLFMVYVYSVRPRMGYLGSFKEADHIFQPTYRPTAQHFHQPIHLIPEDGGVMSLRNVSIRLQGYEVSPLVRPQCEPSSQYTPHNLHPCCNFQLLLFFCRISWTKYLCTIIQYIQL
jgi:hypothetical protein